MMSDPRPVSRERAPLVIQAICATRLRSHRSHGRHLTRLQSWSNAWEENDNGGQRERREADDLGEACAVRPLLFDHTVAVRKAIATRFITPKAVMSSISAQQQAGLAERQQR